MANKIDIDKFETIILEYHSKKVLILYYLKITDMEVLEIVHNVNRLPQSQQMLVVERIIHSMREREQPSMEIAAERLYEDYMKYG